ncbi:glycosyltransferase family 4 protein [Halomonas sp. HAL1]|nr:glycosyltransferase family 4 protein [Halomonas sp. HAL1]EHA14324.1 glycosyl transferase [Halomonas sp. HAL1]WKV92416.1 glycosyltransferase family 4 protein [Halomonas sp. HAL1]
MPTKFLPMPYPTLPYVWRLSSKFFLLSAKILEYAILRYVRKLGGFEQFDVVHIHELGGSITLAKAIKKRANVPVIVTVHGRHPALFKYQNELSFIKKAFDYSKWFDKVFLVGRPLEDFVKKFGFKSNDISVLHNGHQSPNEDPERVEKMRSEYSGKTLISSVARLYPFKGTDITLKALANLYRDGLVDWHYLHVGEGPEKPSLENLAKEYGIQNNVTFLGHLPYIDAMTVIAASDLFVMPSWLEAFGIVYVEAMARGKPVIGCWDSGAEESIRHEIDGFLARRKNADDVESALRKLITDSELRMKMGANGLRRVADFTWAKNSESYIKVYDELSESSR